MEYIEYIEDKEIYECDNCNDTGLEDYYHDAGDHFSMNPSPFSGWRKRPCRICNKED